MALTIHQPSKDEENMPPLIADRRLYLSADRAHVIEEGENGAAFLLIGRGGTIAPGEVKRLGLTEKDGCVVVAKAPAEKPVEETGEEKAKPKPADKAKRKPNDKSRKKARKK